MVISVKSVGEGARGVRFGFRSLKPGNENSTVGSGFMGTRNPGFGTSGARNSSGFAVLRTQETGNPHKILVFQEYYKSAL
jgi:hypothetical protein